MSSANTNLRSFPPRPPQPVDAEDLRRNSRRLLELEAIREDLRAQQTALNDDLMRLRRLTEIAKRERRVLMIRLARGAQLAG